MLTSVQQNYLKKISKNSRQDYFLTFSLLLGNLKASKGLHSHTFQEGRIIWTG